MEKSVLTFVSWDVLQETTESERSAPIGCKLLTLQENIGNTLWVTTQLFRKNFPAEGDKDPGAH
jgi:hypothetical protein